MLRHWTINGRFLTQPVSGVQRVARELVMALDALATARHPLAADVAFRVVRPPAPDVAPPLSLQTIPIENVGHRTGHAWEQVELPRHVRGGLISICNTGPIAVGRQILCIHDVNTILAPQSYALSFRLAYRILLPLLARRVAEVVTVSRASAEALSRYRVVPGPPPRVIYNGHEHVHRWVPRHSPATAAVAGPGTIVVLGSPARHKNLAVLLAIAPELARHGLKLAVVGRVDPRVFAGGGHEAGRPLPGVVWLGGLADDELAALLGDCLCLAFPSLVEGFGLPPLEAMALGCPVVASNASCLPEICADAALYAQPQDPQAWLAALLRLQADPDLGARLRIAGRRRAESFRWDSAAVQWLEAMARVDQHWAITN